MNAKLKLFTDPAILARVQRNVLSRFLEDNQAYLQADAAALLTRSLNSLTFEENCSAWATQFGFANQFGAPLLEALYAIEFLALPENSSILNETLAHLPPGCEPSSISPLNQALHLWLLAHSPAGVIWPSAEQGEERREEAANSSSSSFSSATAEAEATAKAEHPAKEGPFSVPPSSICEAPQAPAIPLSTLNSQPSTPAAVPLSSLPSSLSSPPQAPISNLPSPISAADADDPAQSDAAAAAVPIRRLKPWLDPIPDAPALFDQVHDRALHYLYLPPGAAVVFTLWPGHAHAVKAFTHSPRLYVTSTEPGCGKTTALDFIACLCPEVLRTDNLKPAVLFRVTHKHEPTLVLDEFDSYAHQYPDLRGLINAGHNLHGCATRCEGPNVRFFKAYAATAIAGIGDLAPTLLDRSIVISLAKAPAGALHVRFDRRHTKFETTLGRQIARWVQDNYPAIAACDPVMPPEVINRLADNWRPLFAIAQIIGGHWPQRLLEAFTQLTAKPQPATPSGNGSISHAVPAATVKLLTDIREIFARSNTDRLFSTTLVKFLLLIPDRPWSGPNTRKGFTEARLAQQLLPLGIVPRKITVQALRAKGYKLADFKPAFALLPPAQ